MLYSLIHHITCRLEARQALIYQLVSGLTGENGKYNYSKAVHLYPPFFDIFCSPKNYKIALALTPLAHRVLEEQGIDFFVRPQPVHDRASVELKRDAFSYDEVQDVYLCPNGKHLKLNSLHRSASGLYWVYLADKQDCQSCPLRTKCLGENDRRGARKLEHSYFAPERRRHLARQQHADYQQALKKRQIWCEGTFAAQKWGHNLTRILRRDLETAEDHCLLSATALNLKRMIRSRI